MPDGEAKIVKRLNLFQWLTIKIDRWVSLIILPEDETLKLSSRIYFVILLIYQDLLFQQDVLGVWEGGVISTSAKEGGWRLYFHPCLSVCL